MGLKIFADQVRHRQLPECTAQSPKDSKRGAFETARDVRMLKDLRGVDLAQVISVSGHGRDLPSVPPAQ